MHTNNNKLKIRIMKHLFFILLGSFILCSCQDRNFESEVSSVPSSQQNVQDSSAFLVFSSKDELAETISNMKSGKNFSFTKTAKATANKLANFSSENIKFVSLLEANKSKIMKKLSPLQIDSINKDEDDLEFCMSDSIIADYEFAQLLNASREIQVNDTVYKYYENGVAFTGHLNAAQLKDIDSEVSKFPVSYKTIGQTYSLKGNVKFIPFAYAEIEDNENKPLTSEVSNRESITLKNGITIPANDIRDVDYESKGDGGWLHRVWNGLWGKNVLAIKKFNKHKRLRLGFFDQNYIIYANIGVTMKMQKKVCGIWWNCKADEIRVGWSAIELKYTFSSPVIKNFNPNVNPSKAVDKDYPAWFKHNFPFRNENSVLFYLPFTSYNIKVKNVNSLLKSGIKSLINKGTKELKNLINYTPENQRGLYSVNNYALYVVTGSDEFGKTRVRTFTKKFYAKWLPGIYSFGFSYNGNFNLKSIYIDGGKSTKLSSGTVYGAVKYKGKWLAARITKSKK